MFFVLKDFFIEASEIGFRGSYFRGGEGVCVFVYIEVAGEMFSEEK